LTAKLLPLWVALWALPAGATRTHVVAIGNDRGHGDEAALAYAEHDAEALGRVLRQYGGVRAQDFVLVTGAGADEVRRTIEEVNRRIRQETSSDDTTLIVYYSGHADATGLHLGDSTLPYDELRTLVAGSAAKVRVLILDGCRSGGLTRVKGAKAADSFAIRLDDHLPVEGLAVMTSSAAGEDSQESDELAGSFFTHHLLAALTGAGDRDHDGKVTLTEAYAYAFRNTLRSTGRTDSLQHPTYAYDLKGRGDLVITRLDAAPGTARLKLGEPATYLVREGDEEGRVHAELSPDEPGAVVLLPPGPYFVQQRRRDDFLEYRVALRAGETSDLGATEPRRVAYAQLVRKGASPATSGVYLLGAVEGPVLEGAGPAPGAVVAYVLDLPWATFSVRGRFAQASGPSTTLGGATRTFGVGLTAERVLDLQWASLSVGLMVEGLRTQQTFQGDAVAPDRTGWGLAFGALGAFEVPVSHGFGLRLEGGPLTRVARVAEIDNGAATGARTTGRLTWWAAGGVGVRF
jgi:hypothetical protein